LFYSNIKETRFFYLQPTPPPPIHSSKNAAVGLRVNCMIMTSKSWGCYLSADSAGDAVKAGTVDQRFFINKRR